MALEDSFFRVHEPKKKLAPLFDDKLKDKDLFRCHCDYCEQDHTILLTKEEVAKLRERHSKEEAVTLSRSTVKALRKFARSEKESLDTIIGRLSRTAKKLQDEECDYWDISTVFGHERYFVDKHGNLKGAE